MSRMNNQFDPYDIEKKDMQDLANDIETYLNAFQEVMIIPKELEEQYGAVIRASIDTTKKLIRKLRKGDTSVFKDPDEWERYSVT